VGRFVLRNEGYGAALALRRRCARCHVICCAVHTIEKGGCEHIRRSNGDSGNGAYSKQSALRRFCRHNVMRARWPVAEARTRRRTRRAQQRMLIMPVGMRGYACCRANRVARLPVLLSPRNRPAAAGTSRREYALRVATPAIRYAGCRDAQADVRFCI